MPLIVEMRVCEVCGAYVLPIDSVPEHVAETVLCWECFAFKYKKVD